MGNALVLMFHGIDGPRSRGAGYAADPHYTVEASRFREMLDALGETGRAVGSARDLIDVDDHRGQVWLTFDDGDASNALEALPALAAKGMKADFFVNPARVGRRGFLDWAALRDLSDAGMSIQSHGHTHTYFTALDRDALIEELRVSKARLEEGLGRPVTLLAPPGGRVPAGLVPLARSLGYRAVLDSTPGLVRRRDGREALPRVAVTGHHDATTVRRWAEHPVAALRPLRLRHAVLGAAKAFLGDARYERWRHRALGTSP